MTGIEIAAIAAFISALKNLKDLTASLGDEVPQQVHDEILALSERFSSVQVGLLAAQQHAIELTERCRALEDDLKRVKDWEAVRVRYALQTLPYVGAAVYIQKPDVETPEDPHWLCTNCFENREKSHLQPQPGLTARGEQTWKCSRCRATFGTPSGMQPRKP